ncbi:hypothetical protein Nepgr_010507 [Nepenthes gracilis]|uniref:Uncharacterized protein n=1 Tax=Nepenthes gracilis TaxID=150966 RepID=A0AAD3XL52_NEPGR|nr:hypothetical protein Nepgr_010507 [Nepenthes gracilis]
MISSSAMTPQTTTVGCSHMMPPPQSRSQPVKLRTPCRMPATNAKIPSSGSWLLMHQLPPLVAGHQCLNLRFQPPVSGL